MQKSDPWLKIPVLGRIHLRSRRRTEPGTRPGAIVADPEAPPPRISVIQYDQNDHVVHEEIPAKDLSSLVDSGKVTWVNVDGLGDANVIRTIGQSFGIHNLVLEDIVNVHQRAKVEEFEDHLFVVARMVHLKDHLHTEQISLIIGPDYVITFQEHPGDCLDPLRRRIRKSVGRIRSAGADYLGYAILDAVIDGYFPILDRYSEQLDALELRLTTHQPKHVLSAIHRLRSEVFLLRRAIWPHREMVNSLLRDMQDRFDKETLHYLRDCYDHTVQIIDIVESSREIASDIRDYHFSQIGLRQNEIMKVLTVISSVFIPLAFVAGLYGMNFDNMPELHWVYGYPFALAVMGTIGLGMLIFFWRRGWLTR